jgi:hypothetical protein
VSFEPPYTQIGSPEGRASTTGLVRYLQPRARRPHPRARDRKRLFGLGNQLWHSDSSYKVIPARYSLLCRAVIPPEGGNNRVRRHARRYDMLDPKTRR